MPQASRTFAPPRFSSHLQAARAAAGDVQIECLTTVAYLEVKLFCFYHLSEADPATHVSTPTATLTQPIMDLDPVGYAAARPNISVDDTLVGGCYQGTRNSQ